MKTVHRKLKDKQYNVQIKEKRTNNDLQNTTQKIKERQTIQRRKIKEWFASFFVNWIK
jgi:hypothetical protein